MFLHNVIAEHVARLMRENNEKIEANQDKMLLLMPSEETKDDKGNLHSFDDKPAFILKNPITDVTIYQWYNHGKIERNSNKPAIIYKHKIKNLTSVKTFDEEEKPHSFNGEPYSIQTFKFLGVLPCFSIKTWYLKNEFIRQNKKPPIVARYLFGKAIGINVLYNTPIMERDLQLILKHTRKTKAPIWASWFLITKAITQEQFNMFIEEGTWNTDIPVKWVLYAWNPEGIFLTGKVISANDAYTSGEYSSGYFRQQTSITTQRLLYNLEKENIN